MFKKGDIVRCVTIHDLCFRTMKFIHLNRKYRILDICGRDISVKDISTNKQPGYYSDYFFKKEPDLNKNIHIL